jgi:hypothetical protein
MLRACITAAGGEVEFDNELHKMLQHASSLRNGLRCSRVTTGWHAGMLGLVGRIRFDDDVCWAVKIGVADPWAFDGAESAVKVMQTIEQYCPTLPVPRAHGHVVSSENSTLIYYFMDWITGQQLYDLLDVKLVSNSSGILKHDITIPERIVRQMAVFDYNLRTCPIPQSKSERSLRFAADSVVAELVNDPLYADGIVAQHTFKRGALKATSWARNSFVAYHLLSSEASVPPYDAFDKMVVFAWVYNKLKDTDSLPFVLFPLDLSPFNVLIDENQSLSG